jgi:hypothetical protein
VLDKTTAFLTVLWSGFVLLANFARSSLPDERGLRVVLSAKDNDARGEISLKFGAILDKKEPHC